MPCGSGQRFGGARAGSNEGGGEREHAVRCALNQLTERRLCGAAQARRGAPAPHVALLTLDGASALHAPTVCAPQKYAVTNGLFPRQPVLRYSSPKGFENTTWIFKGMSFGPFAQRRGTGRAWAGGGFGRNGDLCMIGPPSSSLRS